MARMVVVGMNHLERYSKRISNLFTYLEKREVAARAAYAGAGVAADALRGAVEGLSRISDYAAINAHRRGEACLISVSQKNGLREGLGITPMRIKPLRVNVKVGFDGYNDVVSAKWPNGQPNRMIAASCEHGASYMIPQPFIGLTREAYGWAIVLAMKEEATETINRILSESY